MLIEMFGQLLKNLTRLQVFKTIKVITYPILSFQRKNTIQLCLTLLTALLQSKAAKVESQKNPQENYTPLRLKFLCVKFKIITPTSSFNSKLVYLSHRIALALS